MDSDEASATPGMNYRINLAEIKIKLYIENANAALRIVHRMNKLAKKD